MNILYDTQIFSSQKVGGISRYHSDLLYGLEKKGVSCTLGGLYSNNLYLKEAGYNMQPQFEGWEHFITHKRFMGKYYLACLYAKWKPLKNSNDYNREYLRNLIKKQKFDVFHPTYYDDLYDDMEIPPMVLTIHDMIFESFPQYFASLNTISNKYYLAQKARKIIAVSEYTKREILKYYDFLETDRVEVVYHGIELNRSQKENAIRPTFPYLLFVGQRGGYKNFYFLVRAMKEFQKRRNDLKLICVGSNFSKGERDYIQLLGMDKIILDYGRVSDADLISLYVNSFAYVSPSLIEGFGLPLLEAMKYETPMILSDIPIYNEIAQDAAIYFDPMDEHSFSVSLCELFDVKDERIKLIEKGINRVQFFTKEKMLENTYNVYKHM